jgi:Sulfotransferase domain
MPMGFPLAGFESGQRYRPQAADIFVASYPKCGTTWTQYIVYLLENEGRPLAAGAKLDEVFPHLEEVGEERIRLLPEARLIKTHLLQCRHSCARASSAIGATISRRNRRGASARNSARVPRARA